MKIDYYIIGANENKPASQARNRLIAEAYVRKSKGKAAILPTNKE